MKIISASKGFTLLEILVATSIFALIGIGSYTLLTTVITTREVSTIQARELAELQKMYTLLEQDLSQINAKNLSTIDDKTVSALQIGGVDGSISLARGGRTNPLDLKQSDQMGIAYVLERDSTSDSTQLVRYVWTDVNQGVELAFDQRLGSMRQILSSNISAINIRVLDNDREWASQWPKPEVEGKVNNELEEIEEIDFILPMAIEISISHGIYGELTRKFLIPRGAPDDNA